MKKLLLNGMLLCSAIILIGVQTGFAIPINQCPTANPLSVTVEQDYFVFFYLPGSDPDGDPVEYGFGGVVPAHGDSSIYTNTGYAFYDPDTGYVGPDSFNYTVSDGLCSTEATVSITVEVATPPDIAIISPQPNVAVQDGFVLQGTASDFSGIYTVSFSVREPDGGEGIPIGYDDLEASYNSASGYWEYPFDTTQLQDGYYVIFAKATDNAGNEGMSSVVPFSIRNWAVIVQLPSTPNSKAGRTMPIKFSLRIAKSVDPAMPFVYNEDLHIRIYRCDNTSCSSKTLLQTSVYGTKSTNYRIDVTAQLYQTNFQTTKIPAQYLVEIWRPSNNFLVGSFTFKTVK